MKMVPKGEELRDTTYVTNGHVRQNLAVIDYYGSTDFLPIDLQRLPGGMVHHAPDSPGSKLVGGPIQEHKDRVREANPITYVDGDAPTFLIINGDRDPLVPNQQSVLLKDALVRTGMDGTFYKEVEGEGHGGFKDPQVAKLTRTFIERHL